MNYSEINEMETIKPLAKSKYAFGSNETSREVNNYYNFINILKPMGSHAGVEFKIVDWPLKNRRDTVYFEHTNPEEVLPHMRVRVVGYARVSQGNAPNTVGVGLIYLDSEYRRKGIGMAFYRAILASGLSVISDAEHTPNSIKLWDALCRDYDVRLYNEDGPADKRGTIGDRLTSTKSAYDSEYRLIASPL